MTAELWQRIEALRRPLVFDDMDLNLGAVRQRATQQRIGFLANVIPKGAGPCRQRQFDFNPSGIDRNAANLLHRGHAAARFGVGKAG